MVGEARRKCECGLFYKQLNECTWACKCGRHAYVPKPNYETYRRAQCAKTLHSSSDNLSRERRTETKKV